MSHYSSVVVADVATLTSSPTARSSRQDVRNPVLALSAARAILAMPADALIERGLFGLLLRQLGEQARTRAYKDWSRGKGFMAAMYWRPVSVIAKHVGHVVDTSSAQTWATSKPNQPTLRERRNLLFELQGVCEILTIFRDGPVSRKTLGKFLRQVAKEAREAADREWARSTKFAEAGSWRPCAVYAKHLALVFYPPRKRSVGAGGRH